MGSGAASRAIASAASPRGGGGSGGGAGYNPMGQPVPGWQKPLTSFFKSDPNAPPPSKMKDEEVEGEGGEEDRESWVKSKKPRKTVEDEENDPPNHKTEVNPKVESLQPKKRAEEE